MELSRGVDGEDPDEQGIVRLASKVKGSRIRILSKNESTIAMELASKSQTGWINLVLFKT